MKIGEASKASGVSVRSLRFYETERLITPGRCGNGYRDYCEGTIEQVRTIRSLLESGLPIKLIKEVLPHLAYGDVMCPEFLNEVEEYRDQLARRIAALTVQEQALSAFLHAARDLGTAPA